VDFVRRWSEKSEIGAGRFIGWLDIRASKFYDWCERYGKVNEHNGWFPRDFWLAGKTLLIYFRLNQQCLASSEAPPRVNSCEIQKAICLSF
jgi:hypothetical protein